MKATRRIRLTLRHALLVHGVVTFLVLSPNAFDRARTDIAIVLAVDIALGLGLVLFEGSPPLEHPVWRVVALFGLMLTCAVLSQLAWGETSLVESVAEVARVLITMMFVLAGAQAANIVRQRRTSGFTSDAQKQIANPEFTAVIVAVAFLANVRGFPSAVASLTGDGARSATQFWWYSLYGVAALGAAWLFGAFAERRVRYAVGVSVPLAVMIGGSFRSGVAVLVMMCLLMALRLRRRAGLSRYLPLLIFAVLGALISRSASLLTRFELGDGAGEGRRGLELQEALDLLNSGGLNVVAFGEGIGASLVAGLAEEFRSATIHNSLVGALIQSGVVGFTLFFIALLILGVSSMRGMLRTKDADHFAFAAIAICGLILSPLFSVLWGEPLWSAAAGYSLASASGLGRAGRAKGRLQRSTADVRVS